MRSKRFFRMLAIAAFVLAVSCSKPSAQELMSKARDALAHGQPRTAQIHLKNLLRDDPKDAAARALLGQVTLLLGDPVGAEADLRRALELGADAAGVQLPLLGALSAQGKFADVLEQIDKGPKLEGDQRVAELLLAGAAHRGLKQPKESEAAYRAALALKPGAPEVSADLASLLLDQGRAKEAQDLVAAVLSEHPDFGPALVLRGRFEILSGRLPDAEATFRRVVQAEGKRGADYLTAQSLLVETLAAQGDIEKAAAGADELLAAYPNQPTAIAIKAGIELKQGALDSARQRLEALIAKAPTFEPANRLLGMINGRQGRPEQAQMYLQSAVTQDPNDRVAMLQLGGLKLDQGDLKSAKDLLTKAVKPAAPNTDAVLFALAGRASLQAGEPNLGAKFFEQSGRTLTGDPQEIAAVAAVYATSGQLEQAQRLLKGASAKDAGNAWIATYVLALTQIRQGDLKAADATVARLIGQQPKAAWPLNVRGGIAIMSKDLGTARRYYSAALEKDPKYVPALLNLSSVDLLDKQPDRAAAGFKRVLDIDPKQPAALAGLAALALGKRDYAEAQQWIARLPASPNRLRLEGGLALAQGRAADAADRFAQLFAEQPSADTALQAYAAADRAKLPNPEQPLLKWVAVHPSDERANLALGGVAIAKGDDDSAIRRYEAVVGVDPKQPVALNNLAWLYSRKGDDRALDFARRAHDAAPDNPQIADTLGWLEVQHGDAQAGLPLLEQAHKAQPDSAEIGYHWAAALAKSGRKEEAAGALRKVLAAKASFDGRADAERLLRELE